MTNSPNCISYIAVNPVSPIKIEAAKPKGGRQPIIVSRMRNSRDYIVSPLDEIVIE